MIPAPGDIFCVRTQGFVARLIRFGATLRYLFSRHAPNYADLSNHVVIVTHQKDGVWWGCEGRPGGVGYCDLTQYLNDPLTITNYEQPKTDAQRALIVATVPQVLGVKYDWTALMLSAADDLHIPELFAENWAGQGVPGHLICSALASWLYRHVGLAGPPGERDVQPSDWATFCIGKGWLPSGG